MIVKAKCIDCWEDLGDYETLFKIPNDIHERIKQHIKKGHAVQEIKNER